MQKPTLNVHFKTAVLFAVSFVMLAVVIKINQSPGIHIVFQMFAVVAYGMFLFSIFSRKQLVIFAGFALLLIGHNYIWQDEHIHLFWKVAASAVVMLQIATLGDNGKQNELAA